MAGTIGINNNVRRKVKRSNKPKTLMDYADMMTDDDIRYNQNVTFMRLKNKFYRISALLTGTTIFHSFKRDNILGWKKSSFSSLLSRRKDREHVTLKELADRFGVTDTLVSLKNTLNDSGFKFVKDMLSFARRPGFKKTKLKRDPKPTKRKLLSRQRVDGSTENIHISETNAPNSKQVNLTEFNGPSEEYKALRRHVKRQWARSFSDINNDFAKSIPVIRHWDDMDVDVGCMSPQSQKEVIDTNLKSSFTVRNGRVFVGEKFGNITSPSKEKSVEDLYSSALKQGLMRDKNGKNLSEKLGLKQKFEECKKRFVFSNALTVGSNILKRNKYLCAADELSQNLKLKTFERSIATHQKSYLKELQYDMKFATSNKKVQNLNSEIEFTKSMINNPSYDNWCKLVHKRDALAHSENNLTPSKLIEQKIEFNKAMQKAPVNDESVTLYQNARGEYKIMVMVPDEINNGQSPTGDMEVELKRIKSIADLPDGVYMRESDIHGLDDVEIKGGKEVTHNNSAQAPSRDGLDNAPEVAPAQPNPSSPELA